MLDTLTIKNFQAHSNTVLEFEKITTITGPSDRGKSAVIRSLGWCMLNNLAGSAFIRDGETDVSVTLEFDEKHTIERAKGKSSNSYALDGNEFASFGNKVPDPIEVALNLNPVSVQAQFDAPFWLSLSGGPLADALNEVTGIGLLSEMGNKTRTKLKAVQKEKVAAEGAVEFATKQHQQVADFLTPDRIKLAEKLEVGRGKLNAAKERASSLSGSIECLEGHNPALIAEIAAGVEDAASMAQGCKKLSDRYDSLHKNRRLLVNAAQDIEGLKVELASVEEQITELREKEKICPTCNRPL